MTALVSHYRIGNSLVMPKENRAGAARPPEQASDPQAAQPPNRLREWRKDAGLSLEELAFRVGSTTATLSRYERGQRSMTLDLLVQLAPHLGCKPADLLPDPESVLSETERALIAGYKELDPEDRALVLRMVQGLVGNARNAPRPAEAPPRLRRRLN